MLLVFDKTSPSLLYILQRIFSISGTLQRIPTNVRLWLGLGPHDIRSNDINRRERYLINKFLSRKNSQAKFLNGSEKLINKSQL